MKPDPIIAREIEYIEQIIRQETWLESERRGHPVTAEDRIVRERVCSIVLDVGAELRSVAAKSLPAAPFPSA